MQSKYRYKVQKKVSKLRCIEVKPALCIITTDAHEQKHNRKIVSF